MHPWKDILQAGVLSLVINFPIIFESKLYNEVTVQIINLWCDEKKTAFVLAEVLASFLCFSLIM